MTLIEKLNADNFGIVRKKILLQLLYVISLQDAIDNGFSWFSPRGFSYLLSLFCKISFRFRFTLFLLPLRWELKNLYTIKRGFVCFFVCNEHNAFGSKSSSNIEEAIMSTLSKLFKALLLLFSKRSLDIARGQKSATPSEDRTHHSVVTDLARQTG